MDINLQRIVTRSEVTERRNLALALQRCGGLDPDVESALFAGRGKLVPHADVDKVARCLVPEMPQLDPLDTMERQMVLVERWYNHAFQLVFGKPSWVFGRQGIQRSRYARLVREACEAFVERGIAPAAWILWSMREWKQMPQGQTMQAPPTFVLNPKRIRQPRGWHGGVGASLSVKEVLRVPSARELSLRQLAMRDAIQSRVPLTADEVRDIVAEFFPHDSHTSMVERAKSDAANMETDLRSQVYAGRWVW